MEEVVINILSIIGVFIIALFAGKLIKKIKMPAILGWLLIGILFGPHLVKLVDLDIMNSLSYNIFIKIMECFAGIMIGREIIFKKIAKSGKQIIGITIIQSIGTFLVVSAIFVITFLIVKVPIYLAFIFGSIALATAPAPCLSIINEYKTNGPVTNTLLPLAAIDDVIGIIVFFTTINVVGAVKGNTDVSILSTLLMIFLPFIIGIVLGTIFGLILKKIENIYLSFSLVLLGLIICIITALMLDIYLFEEFVLNYLLIGMSFIMLVANLIDEEKLNKIMKLYNPILNISLVFVILNLGFPLDYHLIADAGIYTVIYILSRALGKIGSAFVGGKITKADKKVTKYLGFTLLPHSGVSLVFSNIAISTLKPFDPDLANIISGTIVAAAIINEIIAVIIAKYAFKFAGEIPSTQKEIKSLNK